MPFTDPFNVAHTAIWAALDAYAPWAAAVLAGNRIDLTGDGTVRRAVHRRSALPTDKRSEAEINQTGFRFTPSANSRTSGLSQIFTLYLSDEVTRLANLNDVKWKTLKALMRAGESLGITGLSAKWYITNARDETTINDQQRLAGYQAVLDIVVDMMIPHPVVLAD